MRRLLWKEWHEQAWKLTFGCVVLAALCAIGLRARMVPDATMVEWACGVGVLVLPVLASTGLVPAERAEGGFAALVALLVWMVALTVRLPTEGRAALLAAGVAVLWALVTVALGAQERLRSSAFAASPFSFVVSQRDRWFAPPLWADVLVQAVLVPAAWLVGLRAFARSTEDLT